MDLHPTSETWTGTPGAIAPADGNAATAVGLAPGGASYNSRDDASVPGAQHAAPLLGAADLGANNERLEDLKPKLVHALRELVRQYREEGVVARRHEIRRIRQARLFWQGLQYAWWNPNDMNWHLPFEQRFSDDRALEEMPRYQFVTNFYQGFGLSFIAVLSQDVPSVRFYPQSAQSLEDIAAARAASDVSQLIEQNNHVEQLLTSIGYFLWTDGKLGAYVRYVADGQRFGFHEENILEALEIPLDEDVYVCPQCGKETPAPHPVAQAFRPEGFSSPVAPTTADRKTLTPEGVSHSGDSASSARPQPAAATRESQAADHDARLAAYASFEKAANEDLERSVGAAIARTIEQALPSLSRTENSSAAGTQHPGRAGTGAAPLQARLSAAIRQDIETALKGDRQLGEQIAQILSARRFDNETRGHVVRLIDDRARQLMPIAAKRVLNDWTQTTLAAHRGNAARADAAAWRSNIAADVAQAFRPEEVRSSRQTMEKSAGLKARATASDRRVDYRKLSDEQILDL